MVDEFTPDLAYISEANLFNNVELYQQEIQGYEIVTTKGMQSLGYSRLVLLIRTGLSVTILDNLMEDQVASIWVRISSRGRKTQIIGGVYREHRLLLQGEINNTGEEALQTLRWKAFLSQWRRASLMCSKCHVIGDLQPRHVQMELA